MKAHRSHIMCVLSQLMLKEKKFVHLQELKYDKLLLSKTWITLKALLATVFEKSKNLKCYKPGYHKRYGGTAKAKIYQAHWTNLVPLFDNHLYLLLSTKFPVDTFAYLMVLSFAPEMSMVFWGWKSRSFIGCKFISKPQLLCNHELKVKSFNRILNHSKLSRWNLPVNDHKMYE